MSRLYLGATSYGRAPLDKPAEIDQCVSVSTDTWRCGFSSRRPLNKDGTQVQRDIGGLGAAVGRQTIRPGIRGIETRRLLFYVGELPMDGEGLARTARRSRPQRWAMSRECSHRSASAATASLRSIASAQSSPAAHASTFVTSTGHETAI